MKITQLIALILLSLNYSFAQNIQVKKDSIKYFDENYKSISKKKFRIKKSRTAVFLGVQGDSVNHRILVRRGHKGVINDKKRLDSLLSTVIQEKIDPSKPLVIIYYPGKDPCNSSGHATRKTLRTWFNAMERKINRVKKSTILYVYKDNSGLYGKNDGFKKWIKDPNNIVERHFFKRHYPCSSFVVISKKGNFISYFGEFSKDMVQKSCRILARKKL